MALGRVDKRPSTDTWPRGTKRREIHVDKPCWETTTENPGDNGIDMLKNKMGRLVKK
jgi:hypothetical protein